MPGRREKSRYIGDIAVWQFADASEPVGRPAKRISNRRSILAVELAVASNEPRQQEDDEDNDVEEEQLDIEDGAVASHSTKSRKRRAAAATAGGTVTYPALLWELLSGFIHPESVATYAALCRDANRAMRTRAFWRRLYLRWAWGPTAAADDTAPHELRLAAVLSCNQRVRPRVIRALHRWYFAAAGAQTVTASGPKLPSGLRYLRFAVRGRCLLVLFRRGPPPPPPKPPADTWEEAAEAASPAADQRCPTEDQWLLTVELESGGLPPVCLEELLALDGRYVLTELTCCLTVSACGGGSGAPKFGGGSGGRWCELSLRAPHGDSRSVAFACAGAAPQLLPWWRPGFLTALRA